MKSLQANRGQGFERLLTRSAAVYRLKNQALIDKIPTSWIVQRAGKRIVSAFPEKKSGVDYIGIIASGRPVAIEAKSTIERTRFPLSLVERHQFDFLEQWHTLGGISFLLVEFSKLREIYRVPFTLLQEYVEAAEAGGRKSIPYEEIKLQCDEIKSREGVPVAFLDGLL